MLIIMETIVVFGFRRHEWRRSPQTGYSFRNYHATSSCESYCRLFRHHVGLFHST